MLCEIQNSLSGPSVGHFFTLEVKIAVESDVSAGAHPQRRRDGDMMVLGPCVAACSWTRRRSQRDSSSGTSTTNRSATMEPTGGASGSAQCRQYVGWACGR